MELNWNDAGHLLPKRDSNDPSFSTDVVIFLNHVVFAGYYCYDDDEWVYFDPNGNEIIITGNVRVFWTYFDFDFDVFPKPVIDGD
jgi:hypothetical protein